MDTETATTTATALDPDALLDLLGWLDRAGYDFVPPAPATHANRLAGAELPPASDTREILGWSRSFDPRRADPALVDRLAAAGALQNADDGQRSRFRVARVRGRLFLHSAYPTSAANSVFLGPDSYRYVDLIDRQLPHCPAAGRYVDIGTGSGVAAIVTALARPAAEVFATDLNPAALDLAHINARHAGVDVTFIEGRGLAGTPDGLDVVMSNPPFMIDPEARLYRDGGGMHGLQVAFDMAQEAMARLARGGRLVLFTGSPIIAGADPFRAALADAVAAAGQRLDYRELDPDVYGEELLTPAYAGVDRIALVGAIVVRS
ncbi:methyltransferase [Sandarakinorhabdus sp. DWP1-3-1]|uniref:methyltransferase n=1 Tax=Sandarakinorhabdus sp. DWP1-3-1 TaxID=2804627 RepID=UPI003CEABC7A